TAWGGGSANLDLLRTFAVLFVVISHLPISHVYFKHDHYVIQAMGLLGVGIFFVHTCFVLMMSLERLGSTEGTEQRGLKFLIRRFFRIYPLSIFTVLIVAAIGYMNSGSAPDLPMFISNLLLIQNITGHHSNPPPLWSLPFEVQMYLLLPLIYLGLERSKTYGLRFLFLLLIASIILVLVLWYLKLNYHLFKYIPCFIPGVMAFTLRKSRHRLSPVLFFTSLVFVALTIPYLVALGYKENLLLWPICLTIGLTLPFISELQSFAIRAASKTIAKYSYGIYLIHMPWIGFSFVYLKNISPILQWTIFLSGVGLLSFIAYRSIEEPFVKLGIRISHYIGRAKPADIVSPEFSSK
ncbi:MAG: acyltransferase, partial [Arenimonas sp.]